MSWVAIDGKTFRSSKQGKLQIGTLSIDLGTVGALSLGMNATTNAAETIVTQLGGYGPLAAMIGASDFDAMSKGVWFAFKGSRIANAVEIKIEGDLYNVEFFKGPKSVGTNRGIDASQLRTCIEQKTKLYLSL